MRQAWRWYGPTDPVSLDDIRQAGATDIVSALHDIPIGEVWGSQEIDSHKAKIEMHGAPGAILRWSVVESIPVHDAIKRADPAGKRFVDNYIQTLRALAKAGIKTICYNFMPLLDWTRTDLEWIMPSGARALRFDATAFAAFDLFILKRPDAAEDYDTARRDSAEAYYWAMGAGDVDTLTRNILAGLPGSTTEASTLEGLRKAIRRYDGIGRKELRANLVAFLHQILPVAEDLGIRLAIHPDDPPRPLLGLPRVVSTRDDLAALFSAASSDANGLTFCSGSLGVHPQNNLPAMVCEFGHRIYFAHLRGTRRERDVESFHEAQHLDSDVDMVAVIRELLAEEQHRQRAGRSDYAIPFRPDHGHQMLDDLRKVGLNPGYTAIGRLKGLAELRGVITALEYRQ
ncbi:mannonate dehydratase [Hoeflea sp. TYP-13]|uniref:mannonate dehydratase n=1 Tax=Hoeflea sp. TYP-13 TaxID=3230023 RepID=UPI0034C5C9D9